MGRGRQGYCLVTGVRRAQRRLLWKCACYGGVQDAAPAPLAHDQVRQAWGKKRGEEMTLDGRARTAERGVELRARGDLEFGEDLVEVEPHRARRQVEPLATLAVGSPLSGQHGNLQLLGRQPLACARLVRLARLAGGAQLLAGALGPGKGAICVQRVARRAQPGAGLDDAPLPSRPGLLDGALAAPPR